MRTSASAGGGATVGVLGEFPCTGAAFPRPVSSVYSTSTGILGTTTTCWNGRIFERVRIFIWHTSGHKGVWSITPEVVVRGTHFVGGLLLQTELTCLGNETRPFLAQQLFFDGDLNLRVRKYS